MNKDKITKISKLLSFVLQHNPQDIDLVLDENGWTYNMKHRSLIEKVLDVYDIHIDFFDVLYMWNKPHRHFHTTENHLFPMLDDIISFTEKYNCSEDTFCKLVMCAIFHDIIYDPKSFTNEKDSVMYLHSNFRGENFNVLNDISEVILETKEHKSTTKLSEMFWR